MKEKDGRLKVKVRTARKKLQAGCRRIKEWRVIGDVRAERARVIGDVRAERA